jgi:rifampicin phosphotransferase
MWVKIFPAQIDQWVDSFMQQDLSLLDDRALWNQGLPLWRERGAYAWSTNLRISTSSGWFIYVLDWLVKWWTARQGTAQDLVTALPGLFSAEVGPALWQMAQTLRELHLHDALLDTSSATASPLLQKNSAAQPFLEQLEHFLQRHGHRCPNELELLNPRWAEAPEQIVELIVSYLQADESSNPIEAEQRQRQHRAQAMASIEARLDPTSSNFPYRAEKVAAGHNDT